MTVFGMRAKRSKAQDNPGQQMGGCQRGALERVLGSEPTTWVLLGLASETSASWVP